MAVVRDIAVPVAVNLLTALALFVASLAFKPVREFFFPPELVPDYPLYCTFEPWVDPARRALVVDLFIINTTPHEYTRADLQRILNAEGGDPDAVKSPDLMLDYWRKVNGAPVGLVGTAERYPDFNRDKGIFEVSVTEGTNQVRIRIDQVAPRAIVKIGIPIYELPGITSLDVSRTNKAAVPLDFSHYQDACYQRE